MNRKEAKEAVGWLVLLPAAVAPWTILGALILILVGILIVWWK